MTTTPLDALLTNIDFPIMDTSVLTSAPQVALMLQSLSILAACMTDVSLHNQKTAGMIHLLKTPSSFRASLYQTSACMSDAFRTADQAMFRIKINLDDVPHVITSMINAYSKVSNASQKAVKSFKPDDPKAKFVGDIRLKNFHEIVKICSEEANRARKKFDGTLVLLQELIQVTTATIGDNEEKIKKVSQLLAAYESEMAVLQESKEKLQVQIMEQKNKINEATATYERAIRKIEKMWKYTIVFDTLKQLIPFVSFGDVDKSINDSLSPKGGFKKFIEGISPAFSKFANSASTKYEKSAEHAKNMYMYQREMEQLLLKEDAANRMALAQIAGKIANANVEQLDMEEILYYLARGVKILGQVQQHWTILQNFFASLESVVSGTLSRHLVDFETLDNEGEIHKSDLIWNELAITGYKAAVLSFGVSSAANIYSKISEKYILPVIDSAVIKMVMTKDEARQQLPVMQFQMDRVTSEVSHFLQDKLEETRKTSIDRMIALRCNFQKAFNGTLYSVTNKGKYLGIRQQNDGTVELINHGNILLAKVHEQEQALHNVALKGKSVEARIEDMIANFANHEAMRNPKDTIGILKEVTSTFDLIRTSATTLESNEKELSDLLQNIMVHQLQGQTENGQIQAQINDINNSLVAVQHQINVIRGQLDTMSGELYQLQLNIEEAEHQLRRRRRRRRRWLIATVLTLGVAGFGAIGAFNSVESAKEGLAHRRQMHANTAAHLNNLHTSFHQYETHRTILENTKKQKEFELEQVADILRKLQPSLQDTVQYRKYLLSLSDAFTQVKYYLESLEQNLETVEQLHTAGIPSDESLDATVSKTYKDLVTEWERAKKQPSVALTLNLPDSSNFEGTLEEIIGADLETVKSSLDYCNSNDPEENCDVESPIMNNKP